MAPRVGAKSNQQVAPPVPAKPASEIATADPTPEQVRKLLAHIAGKQAEMLPQSRWVGRDFADAARAMHEGRTAEDMIHGQASPEEARALHDDGLAAMPLPVPFLPPEATNSSPDLPLWPRCPVPPAPAPAALSAPIPPPRHTHR